jgi:hypothetical protein
MRSLFFILSILNFNIIECSEPKKTTESVKSTVILTPLCFSQCLHQYILFGTITCKPEMFYENLAHKIGKQEADKIKEETIKFTNSRSSLDKSNPSSVDEYIGQLKLLKKQWVKSTDPLLKVYSTLYYEAHKPQGLNSPDQLKQLRKPYEG